MNKKRLIAIIVVIIMIVVISVSTYFIIKNERIHQKQLQEKEKEKAEILEIAKIKNNYNTYIRTNKDAALYSNKKEKIGFVKQNTYITLDDNYEIINEYYKLNDLDYYIKYEDVTKTEIENIKYSEYATYKNYIPFNQNIITKNNYKLYLNENEYFEINASASYPILIKENNKYGVEFNNHLVYINSEDVDSIIDNKNSTSETTSAIAVLNYHFTIDANSEERNECLQTICIPETQVDEQIKYLKDNSFYTSTMRDFYLFLNNKIQLPKKTVLITIDDGWYVGRMINILEKYQATGTLFLIGSLASTNTYVSDFLEIHSHTWDMHTPGVCSGTHGGGILCLNESAVLEDLKKSRESLNNSTVFCYPFYEYSDRTEALIKKAGFEMAFIGDNQKAKPNINPYRIPRYVMYDGLSMSRFIKIVN